MDDETIQRLDAYVAGRFALYANSLAAIEFEPELRRDLHEHYREARIRGLSEEEAYHETIASIGELSELLGGAVDTFQARFPARQKFSGSMLAGADFRDVAMDGARFDGSVLYGADFSGARIPRSSLRGCALHDAVFDRADLTGAVFTGSALQGTNFRGAWLEGTTFAAAGLSDACFDGATLTGTVFDHSDLRRASFRQATLRSVSFRHLAPKVVRSLVFDDTAMDKLTYNHLCSGGVGELTGVVLMDADLR